MPDDQHNNELSIPATPYGFADWRAAFAFHRDFLTEKGGHNHHEQLIAFIPPLRFHITSPESGPPPIDYLKIDLIPYWKVAYNAAREQAEYDAANPSLTLLQQITLLSALSAPSNGPLDPQIKVWLDREIKFAREAERATR